MFKNEGIKINEYGLGLIWFLVLVPILAIFFMIVLYVHWEKPKDDSKSYIELQDINTKKENEKEEEVYYVKFLNWGKE